MYWFGIGLELLSACLVAEVCQASRVFLMRKEPLSMTLELSLFTAIPVDKACNYISSKLIKDDKLSSRTSLDSNEIILLLHLSNNYFIYDDKMYNQIHGCAMGSPVSPAHLCMEAIEEVAINTSEVQPRVWKRYADDSFCIIKTNAVNSFHTTLNSIDPHISFTIE